MPTSGYHHLTQHERCQISILKESDFSITQISQKLKIHRSSISRELKRNRFLGSYDPEEAQKLASQRRSKASQHPKKLTPMLLSFIGADLKNFWKIKIGRGVLQLATSLFIVTSGKIKKGRNFMEKPETQSQKI